VQAADLVLVRDDLTVFDTTAGRAWTSSAAGRRRNPEGCGFHRRIDTMATGSDRGRIFVR
jgi:hypothetical protein